MEHWFHSILMFLENYGVIGLFILSFIEASFFPLPSYLLLVPLTLANRQFGPVYALAGIAGSVLGGVFGYAIGFRIGRPILKHLVKPAQLDKLESLFTLYGSWVIAACGLTPVPYKIFTISAGVFRMPVLVFITVSLIARSIYFFSGVVLLMIFGPKIAGFIHQSLGVANFIIIGAVISVLLLFWRTEFIQKKLIPALFRLKVIWQHRADGINGAIQVITRFGWYLIAGATLTVFGFGAFIKLARELLEHELDYFDQIAGQAIIALRVPWLTILMKGITNCGSTATILLITLLLTIFGIIYRRFLIDFIVLDLCVAGALGLSEILKVTFHRVRPPLPWLSSAGGYSFPSGHTFLTLSLYGFLAYLILQNNKDSDYHVPLALALIILAILVGVSRVYLGVHFPSDVAAGWAAAAAWLGTCIAGREILRDGFKLKPVLKRRIGNK